MEKFLAIDDALGAQFHAEIDLAIVADDADRNSAFGFDDLNRHAAESARGSPDQHHVVLAHDVRRPSHQHSIGGRAHQRRRRGFFPRKMLRLRHTLMRLHASELREAAPVGFVAPNLERGIVHRVVAVSDRGTIGIPHAAMHHDMIADLDVVHVASDRIDDARRVAAADMEIRRIVLRLLARSDDVDRRPQRGPHVVEIDSGGHHIDQRLIGSQLGDRNLFDFEGVGRLAESIGPNHLRVHLPGNLPDRRNFADFVDFPGTHGGLFMGYQCAHRGK